MNKIKNLTEWLNGVLGLSPQAQGRVLTSVLIILVLWFLHRLVSRLALQKIDDIQVRYRGKKTANYIAVSLGILLVGRVWFEGIESFTTFLGLFGAGLAIALKDLIVNIAGWVFIIWRRPFNVGDRIQIGTHAGDVIDLKIFQFTLLEIGNWIDGEQSTGRIIHIPNGTVFNQTLANYSRGFQYIWNEIPVVITFESNWRKAKEILQQIADKHAEHLSKEAETRVREASRKFMIFYSKLTPTVYTKVVENGVTLTIRYLCQPRRRRDTTQEIWEDILTEFSKHPEINLAYPTNRTIVNMT